jgi:hypothetical protein
MLINHRHLLEIIKLVIHFPEFLELKYSLLGTIKGKLSLGVKSESSTGELNRV